MRRRFKSGTEYRLTTAAGEVAPNRGSEKPFDMRAANRVRFVDTEMDDVPVYASSRRRKATDQSPISGAAKTSEYEYFRKIKNGVVHGHSRSLHKENEQLKSSKVNYLTRETSSVCDMLKHRRKDLKFSVPGERAGPSDHHLFSSPRVSKYDEPDQIRSEELTNKSRKRSSLLPENVTPVGQSPFSPQLNEASENSETRCSEKRIFSAKRERLRQWVAQTSFSEVDKRHSNGSDLVASLLSRLFPKDNENNDSSKRDADNSCKFLTFHESDNLDKGLHFSHKWDKDLPKLSSEIVLPERDTFISEIPFPSYGTENHVEDKLMDLDQRSMSHVLRNPHARHDFSFCLPFERYRSSGSFHFKELDEFGSIIEHPREEPDRLLLEWDFEQGKDKSYSSIIHQDTTKNFYARLATSRNVDQQKALDNMLDARELCSSSLFSNHYLEFDSLPNYGSTGCLTRNFGPIFDDVKYAMAEPRQFSLSLPCNPKCITQEGNINAENILHDSNIIFSHRDQHWLKNKNWDGKPQSDFWLKCSSTAEISLEDPPIIFHNWQFPQNENSLYPLSRQKEAYGDPFSPFARGAFNHNFLSANLHSSLDTFANRPLLINHVSQDRSGQELFFDDDVLEYR